MKTLLSISLLLLAACGRAPETTPDPQRDVRLLEADDIALRPVLFAAAKHIFDPNASQPLGFGGVYVNKRLLPSLSADLANFINRSGGFQQQSRPIECDAPPMDRQAPPRAPTPPGATGGAPNPPSPPKRTTGAALCNRGSVFGLTYNFTSVRIASDTAYVELQLAGAAKGTKCLVLMVDQVGGGWTPGEVKSSKIGQCGK